MEENKITAKEQREINLIAENLELVKVLMEVFNGQVLCMDLKEFCIKFEIFDTGEAFDYAVEKLIKGKVLKRRIYLDTQYKVIIAKTCVNKYVNGVNDSIDFSARQVRLNCFRNAIMVRAMKRPSCSLDEFLRLVNYNSTFLNAKYGVESAYKFFNAHLKINEIGNKSCRCALYRNSKGLKNVETKGSQDDELVGFTNSFDTFVNKDIYTFHSKNKFTFYILDISDNLNSEKVAKKISSVIGTLYEQIEQLSLLDKLGTVDFVVVARDSVRHEKIVNAFRKTYYKEHVTARGEKKLIKAYQEHLLEATNTALDKRVNNIKVEYVDRNKESSDIFMFRNTYETQYGLNVNIKVLNANLNGRLNMYTRVANLKTASQSKHEKALEKKLRAKIEVDIYRKAEAIHSATEEEIRKAIKEEYGIFDDDFDNE